MNAPKMFVNSVDRHAKGLCVVLGERDKYTLYHSNRVRSLAIDRGKKCSLVRHDLSVLNSNALLNDVGQVSIPDSILLKPGKLTDDEWVIMKTHVIKIEVIVRASELQDIDLAARTARHHRQWFDGTGYPDGLLGGEIPILARILSLADRYDAMITTRSYQRARGHDVVLNIPEREVGHHAHICRGPASPRPFLRVRHAFGIDDARQAIVRA